MAGIQNYSSNYDRKKFYASGTRCRFAEDMSEFSQ